MSYVSYIFVFISLLANLKKDQGVNEVTVSVTNIKKTEGSVIISLYNSPVHFLKEGFEYKIVRVDVKSGKPSILHTFKNLPSGTYAIAVFHDQNDDQKCNVNVLGIPKEGYGFSQNFKPTFSAPDFNDTKFNFGGGNYTTEIKLIH